MSSFRTAYRNRTVQGLLRLWLVATVLWVLGILIVGLQKGPVSVHLAITAILPPLVMLFGAIATVWVVDGFRGRRTNLEQA